MLEAGLAVERDQALADTRRICEEKGYEYQNVFDDYLIQVHGKVDYRLLAAAIVAYRRAKEASLTPYPHVNVTLLAMAKMGLKLGVVSDAPVREAWLRLGYLKLLDLLDAVVTFDDTGVHKPAPEPFDMVCRLLQIRPAGNGEGA